MTGTEPVIVSRDGTIVTLTLNWPERRNALSVAMRHRLADAIEEIEADRSVRAAILVGTGEHFCAGGDLTGMHVESVAEGRERMRHAHRLIRLMVNARLPVVAAIEGWCAGAGISLACACDHVVASTEAKFLASFGKVGLLPDLGLLHTLPARVGQARAREMLFFSEPLDAPRAEAIGLVDRVVPEGGALAAARERAAVLAALAPLTLSLTKAVLAEGLEQSLARERDLQSALYLTPGHAEGKAAFLEKRPPRFGEGS